MGSRVRFWVREYEVLTRARNPKKMEPIGEVIFQDEVPKLEGEVALPPGTVVAG
jgi:hypothetical protein